MKMQLEHLWGSPKVPPVGTGRDSPSFSGTPVQVANQMPCRCASCLPRLRLKGVYSVYLTKHMDNPNSCLG